MLRKLKIAVPAVISAILCVAMALGTAVSANFDDDEYDRLWNETKPITNAKYYPQYIKMIEKYSKKESKNKIAYGKSKTKKLINKLAKTAAADEPEFSLSVTDDIMIAYFAAKEGNWKEVQCIGSYSSARYFTENSSVILDINEKKMADYHSETETEIHEICSELVTFYDFGIDDNAKEKYFKIKNNDKIY